MSRVLAKEHRVVPLCDRAIKSPRHALAHMGWGRGGGDVWLACLLVFELTGRRNGLIGRSGHVEKHLTKVCTTRHATNVRLDGFAPTRAQSTANQLVHVERCPRTLWVGDVGHVGDHVQNFEIIVHREANVQAMKGLTGFQGVLARDDEVIGFDIRQCRFNVP